MLTPANPLVPPSAGGDVEMMAPLAGPNLQRAARVRLVPCGVPATDAKGVFVEEVPLCHTVREVQAALAARLEAAESGSSSSSSIRFDADPTTNGISDNSDSELPLLFLEGRTGSATTGSSGEALPCGATVAELLAAAGRAPGEGLTLSYAEEERRFGNYALIAIIVMGVCGCLMALCSILWRKKKDSDARKKQQKQQQQQQQQQQGQYGNPQSGPPYGEPVYFPGGDAAGAPNYNNTYYADNAYGTGSGYPPQHQPYPPPQQQQQQYQQPSYGYPPSYGAHPGQQQQPVYGTPVYSNGGAAGGPSPPAAAATAPTPSPYPPGQNTYTVPPSQGNNAPCPL